MVSNGNNRTKGMEDKAIIVRSIKWVLFINFLFSQTAQVVSTFKTSRFIQRNITFKVRRN